MPASFSTLALPAEGGVGQLSVHDRIIVPLEGNFGQVAESMHLASFDGQHFFLEGY
jgi:hypothetical protein